MTDIDPATNDLTRVMPHGIASIANGAANPFVPTLVLTQNNTMSLILGCGCVLPNATAQQFVNAVLNGSTPCQKHSR